MTKTQATTAILGSLFAFLVLVTAIGMLARTSNAQEITVYKSPTCSCCEKWIQHLRDNGFTVKALDVENLNQIKVQHGITPETASCHTALVEGYVVEGHVPADVIKRLLTEHLDVKGITVPGMPMGSPGMEGSYRERYQVLTFDGKGNTAVYAIP